MGAPRISGGSGRPRATGCPSRRTAQSATTQATAPDTQPNGDDSADQGAVRLARRRAGGAWADLAVRRGVVLHHEAPVRVPPQHDVHDAHGARDEQQLQQHGRSSPLPAADIGAHTRGRGRRAHLHAPVVHRREVPEQVDVARAEHEHIQALRLEGYACAAQLPVQRKQRSSCGGKGAPPTCFVVKIL